MLKAKKINVTSNLDRFYAFISTTTKGNLRAHKKRVHEKSLDDIPQKLVCALCGYKYKTNRKFNLNICSDKCNKSLD